MEEYNILLFRHVDYHKPSVGNMGYTLHCTLEDSRSVFQGNGVLNVGSQEAQTMVEALRGAAEHFPQIQVGPPHYRRNSNSSWMIHMLFRCPKINLHLIILMLDRRLHRY